MKLQRQGPSECKLATIAMLANVPLERVRQDALKMAGLTSWVDIIHCTSPKRFWHVIKRLSKKYNVEGVISDWKMVVTGSSLRVDPSHAAELDLSGRGELVIIWNSFSGHSVAFEDGVIYDPDRSEPLPFAEWLKVVSKFTEIVKGEK